jgi:2-polyprenyl-3-methyl-5-hydroxy-6-metoxy-1,4-benzoquinol methylase
MKNWKRHWNTFPEHIEETRFLEQVGKTVNKEPITEEQFKEIVSSIRSSLRINPDYDILDLCCGNGIITKEVAGCCRSIVGMDYSQRLVDIAVKYNSLENIEYVHGDAGNVNEHLKGKRFSGIYMYEAMQHFKRGQFQKLLTDLKPLMSGGFALFIGSVPDKSKKWYFYNTFSRKLSYIWRVIKDDEAIGTWWDKDFMMKVCKKNSLKVKFIEQDKKLHTAHYRFDAYISD